MQFHSHANQSYFHNGFALRLALKQRHKGTRKWPIDPFASFACQTADNCDVVKGRFGDVYRFMSRHMCRSLCAFLSRSLINGCYAWWHMIRLAKISTTPRLESANFKFYHELITKAAKMKRIPTWKQLEDNESLKKCRANEAWRWVLGRLRNNA